MPRARVLGCASILLSLAMPVAAGDLDELGFAVGGAGGGTLVFFLGTEEGETGEARLGALEYLQGGDTWFPSFEYEVGAQVETRPALPGYLSRSALTDFDPNGTVASTERLRITFTVAVRCTGVIFRYGHYGSEPDLGRAFDGSGMAIGGVSVIPGAGEEKYRESDNEDPFLLVAGTYTLELRYKGDDPQAPDSEDNGHYIDFLEMTADPGCVLAGV